MYTLLCLFSYFEDNNFDNNVLSIYAGLRSIEITFEKKIDLIIPSQCKSRNLSINNEVVINFAKHHLIDVTFSENKIIIIWD